MTETYNIVNSVSQPIMEKIFISPENKYNLRNFQEIFDEHRKALRYGFETILNLAPFIWANLTNEYKLAAYLNGFKLKMKNWECNVCVCRYAKISSKSQGFYKIIRLLENFKN